MNQCCEQTLTRLISVGSPVISEMISQLFGIQILAAPQPDVWRKDQELPPIPKTFVHLTPDRIVPTITEGIPWHIMCMTRNVEVRGQPTNKICQPGQDYCSNCGHIDDATKFFQLHRCPNLNCPDPKFWNG